MAGAIPALIENTKDDGTVIRWSTAYGLAGILLTPKYSKDADFLATIDGIVKSEEKSSIQNVYLKALKKAKKM